MLNITELATELIEVTAWQETPYPLSQKDYVNIVLRAVRTFFRDINHPAEYDTSLFVNEDGELKYARDFMIDEVEYILILCQLEFFKRVQMDVNKAFSYSTDALSVTNADKPYANLKNTIDDLQMERRIGFNKMVRYTIGATSSYAE